MKEDDVIDKASLRRGDQVITTMLCSDDPIYKRIGLAAYELKTNLEQSSDDVQLIEDLRTTLHERMDSVPLSSRNGWWEELRGV